MKSDIKNKEGCEIPRWQIIKATLNNLNYLDFLEASCSDPNGVVLDVRTSPEYIEDHLPNAINLNYLSQTLADDLESLIQKKNYYVYCRTGRRSLRVCLLMKNMGFNVYNLD
ncbi:MAG: rhodanese-like domain-containing protein, partial [Bacteroidota bacterium]